MIKRLACVILSALLLGGLLCACGEKVDGQSDEGSYTVEAGENGVLKTYTYSSILHCYLCEGLKYTYCLTLTGRMPNAAKDSTYVVLSNSKDITFEDTWKQFLSSDTADWFDPQDAVVVEMR